MMEHFTVYPATIYVCMYTVYHIGWTKTSELCYVIPATAVENTRDFFPWPGMLSVFIKISLH